MPTLSNGNIILSGKYTKDMKIKECSHCGCYSPVQAETCCWCGSEDLTMIDGAKEVKREQTELAEKISSNNKRNGIMTLGGLIIGGLGGLICFSNIDSGMNGIVMFGIMLIILSVIPEMLAATKALNNKVIIKYGSTDNFLTCVSKQLEIQEHFTSKNTDQKYINMKTTLNNDFDTKISKQNFMKLLNIWLEGYISPEVIQIRVNKYFEDNNYTNYKKEVNGITESFYNEGKKVSNELSKRTNDILHNESVQRANIQTNGLNYGLITNSVSNAVLYDVMNSREHRNQYNRQLTPILRNTNSQLHGLVIASHKRNETMYNSYGQKIKKYVREKTKVESKL